MVDSEPVTKPGEARRLTAADLLWRDLRAHRTLVIYWGLVVLGSVATFVAVFVKVGFLGEQHDAWAIADGLTTGLCSAGLILIGATLLQTWLTWLRAPPTSGRTGRLSNLQGPLASALAELEMVRLEARRTIRRLSACLTPVGVAAGLAFCFIEGPPLPYLVVYCGGGGFVGHFLAVWSRWGAYERVYKRRVLPQLVGRFGALTYQRPRLDLARLHRFHIFRHFTFARADDAIVGEYRGLKISIAQLSLTWVHLPLDFDLVFEGLLIEVELKNRLVGTTAIVADAGALGNLRDELAAHDIRRVGLESPAFEHAYKVYGTDQVMARALLTPDFMERFMALGLVSGFGRPLALAQDNVLLVAIPLSAKRDFFGPPGFDTPASDEASLKALSRDIEAMLRIADAAIDLDDATRSRATPLPARRGATGVDGR